MKVKNILFSAIVLSSLVSTNLVVLAEESMSSSSTETTVSTQIEGVTATTESDLSEQTSEPVEKTEVITNPLTNGDELTHTHQADLSQFESPEVSAFSARSSVNAQQAFIDSIAASAQTLANANDLYASVMIAQAIVESGWGRSTLSAAPNYNLFGIKGSYNGQSVTMPTSEFINGQWITVNAAFRKYPSYAESLQDNVTVLKTTSFQPGVFFYSGAWRSNTSSYRDATAWLTGRYATAPNYGSILNNVIETYNLTQYDTPNVDTSPMYRLYNRSTGQHLYTLNVGERNHLSTVGWIYEGIAWQAPNSGQPVYRLYNPNNGDHHYTMAQSEINFLTPLGWRYEGLSFFSGGSKPIYRLFNPNETIGTHHYTLSSAERDSLTPLGWRYEGIGFYAY